MLPEKKVSEAALEKAMGIRMRLHPNWQGQTYYQGAIAGRDRIRLILFGTILRTIRPIASCGSIAFIGS
jgi:hypothetical protein